MGSELFIDFATILIWRRQVELVILTANKHLLSSTQTLSCFRVLLLSSLDTIRTAVIPSLQYVNIDTIGEMLKILKA